MNATQYTEVYYYLMKLSEMSFSISAVKCVSKQEKV